MHAPRILCYSLIAWFLVAGLHAQFLWKRDIMSSPPTEIPTLSAQPTPAEVLSLPRESFATMTPQNKPIVLAILRRLALRADAEIAALTPPEAQQTATESALFFIAHHTDQPSDLAFVQQFFDWPEDDLSAAPAAPYTQTILELENGLPPSSRLNGLQKIARNTMMAYAVAARRLGMDDAAVPALLRKLDDSDYKIAGNAAQALKELRSSSAVEAIERRLREDEANFPLEPWDQKLKDELDERAEPDKRFGKAFIYYSVLSMMKTAEARAAAWAALARWEAIYKNHPDRDKYLPGLSVRRENLTRTAGEILPSKPKEAARPPDFDLPATTLPSATSPSPPGESPSRRPAEPIAPRVTGLLFAVAALVLLAGAVFFFARGRK
jgi:HEAT repeat protein